MKIDGVPTYSGQQQQRAAQESQGQLNQEDFLTLLTAQLSMQDPLNPIANQEFVTQLSQLAGVERMENMSQSIYQLAMAQSANTSSQMVSFIGRDVRVESEEVEVKEGTPGYSFGYQLAEEAESVEVIIRDEDGKVVKTLELGPREEGVHSIDWDGTHRDGGPVGDGTYTFEVNAFDKEGEPLTSSSFVRRQVSGVSFESGLPRLLLVGGGEALLGDVKEVG